MERGDNEGTQAAPTMRTRAAGQVFEARPLAVDVARRRSVPRGSCCPVLHIVALYIGCDSQCGTNRCGSEAKVQAITCRPTPAALRPPRARGWRHLSLGRARWSPGTCSGGFAPPQNFHYIVACNRTASSAEAAAAARLADAAALLVLPLPPPHAPPPAPSTTWPAGRGVRTAIENARQAALRGMLLLGPPQPAANPSASAPAAPTRRHRAA